MLCCHCTSRSGIWLACRSVCVKSVNQIQRPLVRAEKLILLRDQKHEHLGAEPLHLHSPGASRYHTGEPDPARPLPLLPLSPWELPSACSPHQEPPPPPSVVILFILVMLGGLYCTFYFRYYYFLVSEFPFY